MRVLFYFNHEKTTPPLVFRILVTHALMMPRVPVVALRVSQDDELGNTVCASPVVFDSTSALGKTCG